MAKLSTGDEALKILVALAFFAVLFPYGFLPYPYGFLPYPYGFLLLSLRIFAFIPTDFCFYPYGFFSCVGILYNALIFKGLYNIASYFCLDFPTYFIIAWVISLRAFDTM